MTWQQVVVFAEATVTTEPGKRPLNNPALGQRLKAFLTGLPFNNVQIPAEGQLDPLP